MYFRWDAPWTNGGSPIIDYRITVFRMGSGTYVKTIDTWGNVTEKLDMLGTGYYDIYVQARNSVGYSPQCITWTHMA